jgi:hypothetical protein
MNALRLELSHAPMYDPNARELALRTEKESNDRSAEASDDTSELDGDYWKQKSTQRKRTRRVEPAAPTSTPSTSVDPETRTTEHNQLVVRQTFDVGLPIVFGQTSFPSPLRAQQSVEQQPFAALQRLSVVFNPEYASLRAYEGEDVSQNQHSTSYTGKYWMRLRSHWHNLMQDSPELVIPWAASVEDVVNLNPITGVMDRQGVT